MPEFVDHADFLSKSASLRRHRMKRVFFDPAVPSHIDSMKHYMNTGMWLTQFYPEDPYIDVPMTVFRKYAGYCLDILVTTTQKYEEAERADIQRLIRDKFEVREITQRKEGFQNGVYEISQKQT